MLSAYSKLLIINTYIFVKVFHPLIVLKPIEQKDWLIEQIIHLYIL